MIIMKALYILVNKKKIPVTEIFFIMKKMPANIKHTSRIQKNARYVN